MDIQDLINLEKNIHIRREDLQKCIDELSTWYPLKTIVKILNSKEFVDDILSVKTDDDIFSKYHKIVNKDEKANFPLEEEMAKEWENIKKREKMEPTINEYIQTYIKLKELLFKETPKINKDDWIINFDFYKKYTEDMLNYYNETKKSNNPKKKPNKIEKKKKSTILSDRWDYDYKKKKIIKIVHRPTPKSDAKKWKKDFKQFKDKNPESTATLQEYYELRKNKAENEEKERQLKIKKKEEEARIKRDEENKKKKENLALIEYKQALRMNPGLTFEKFNSKIVEPRSFLEKAPDYDISDDEEGTSEDEASHLLEIFKNIPDNNNEVLETTESTTKNSSNNNQPVIKKRKQLCPKLLAGIKCDKIASGCKYLHPTECHFGTRCGKINWIFGGNYQNRNPNDICKRIHSHESMTDEYTKETIESYLKRLNITYQKKNKVIKIKY
jgi:hypothetical protein